MAYPLTAKANRYAREVVSGKIPAGEYVRLACKRHLDDLQREKESSYPYRFDKEKSEHILQFAELMKHVKGKWSGQQIVLESWQCFFLAVPFGWVRKTDNLRRFREIYACIPRKSGKSILGAVIGLYMFAADKEKGAEVYAAATSEAQAYEVFRPAWMMVHTNPDMKKHFNIELGGTAKNPGNIYSLSTASRFETVIGKPGDGSSPHCYLLDEYHEAKTDESYDTGKTGMGARQQPLMCVITTAGVNTSFPCYAKQKQVQKVLSGELVNDELFGIIYTIDKDDDWTKIETWKKANPNYGVSVFEDFLKGQLKTALQDSRKQNIIKCKHLNIWSNAGDAWLNMASWQNCTDLEMSLSDFEGQPCWIGLDLASKKDVAAVMLLFKKNDEYFLFSNYYIPEERTYGEDMAHYAGWSHDGYMETTPGSRIDIERIQDDIRELAKRFDVSGSQNGGGEVCNDPWNAQQLITNLMNEGIGVVEVSQTVNMLSEPMKELESVVLEGKLHHDGNPVTYWMFANVCCRVDKKDNIFPFKEGDENKIDGAVATITAMARAMYNEGVKVSVYEQRGVLTF